jgi:hypothetical protein
LLHYHTKRASSVLKKVVFTQTRKKWRPILTVCMVFHKASAVFRKINLKIVKTAQHGLPCSASTNFLSAKTASGVKMKQIEDPPHFSVLRGMQLTGDAYFEYSTLFQQ